jgi:hypothetical protein
MGAFSALTSIRVKPHDMRCARDGVSTVLFVRFRDLKEAGIVRDRATLRRWMRDQGFPAPKLMGPNSLAWVMPEVEAWIRERPTGPAPQPSRGKHAVATGKEAKPDMPPPPTPVDDPVEQIKELCKGRLSGSDLERLETLAAQIRNRALAATEGQRQATHETV